MKIHLQHAFIWRMSELSRQIRPEVKLRLLQQLPLSNSCLCLFLSLFLWRYKEAITLIASSIFRTTWAWQNNVTTQLHLQHPSWATLGWEPVRGICDLWKWFKNQRQRSFVTSGPINTAQHSRFATKLVGYWKAVFTLLFWCRWCQVRRFCYLRGC